MKIKIKLYIDKETSTIEVEKGTALKQVLKERNPSIFNKFAGVVKDGNFMDFHSPINESGEFQLIPYNDKMSYSAYWHTTSHIMAQAIKRLYKVNLAIGPSIEEGFYYDMEKETPFSEEDLKKISEEMKKIIKSDLPIEYKEIKKKEAKKLFSDNKFKLELIDGIEDDFVSIYSQGEFTDLCRGPHLYSTGKVKDFKLLSVSGSYWRGDEKRESLQRIYGISYPDKKMLKDYIYRYEEAKKRDHRKLGKQLDLFNIYDEIGAGLVLWHPNGAIIREEMETFWKKEHLNRDYKIVRTPHIAKADLWKTSGHFDYYLENMYTFERDGEEYVVKPMNCPYHILIYKKQTRSYRDLPIKYAELGTVYRYERSGTLHGMLRVRGFTQDDAHIFCSEDQIEKEIGEVFDFAMEMIKTFGYKDFEIHLSVRDPRHKEKYAGSDREWEKAESALVSTLENRKIIYKRDEGEAVFYGPKIDIKIKDALGRSWQGPTIQFDFNIPHRFNATYIGEDGKEHMVYMVHRALFGSFERFVGGLIEHYNGNFPTWLAPTQVILLPITNEQIDFSKQVLKTLKDNDIRVTLDERNEKLSKKIRDAETKKIPYMFIIGNKEIESKKVSVRNHKDGDIGSFSIEDILSKIKEEIKKRR
ncbi:threonine--tRNA ligase [candidate division WOR-3 bacterium]|nr:threonine--tRNA ligase [candidate division WOR-3 bacterium]